MKSRNPATLTLRLLVVALSCAASVGCLEVRNNEDVDAGDDGCGMCHDAEGTSGAHAAHIGTDGLFGGGYACEDCHVIPTEWFSPGHINGTVEVVFQEDGLASTGGLEPSFDGSKCTNVYCHGATLGGGTYTEPLWNDPDLPNGMGCGDCHGIPPLQPHPSSGACSECHSAAYTDGELNHTVHINGSVDFLATGDGGV